jgi:CheY-like chemotaxis protein
VACSLVRSAGYEVGEATNGRLAVEAVEGGAWDLVLMDCHMPEMDGCEAARRICQLSGAPSRLPIIALTAAAMADELELCREAGMNECLTKPVNLSALEAVLARWLAPG